MSDTKKNLDPGDWNLFRQQLHDLVDQLTDRMEHVREGPVWRPVPEKVKDQLDGTLPMEGVGTDATLKMIDELILPYAPGNTHPRFMGWVQGGGTPSGTMAALIEAAMNSNAGGREHIAPYIEQQVIKWMLGLFKFPVTGSGILTSGTSMATLNALAVARHALLGQLDSDEKLMRQSRLRVYAADSVHSSLVKAIAMLGLGTHALKRIDCLPDGGIDTGHLRAAIAEDRNAGLEPFAIVGTIGTVATGASDHIATLADIAEAESLWLHIDGAFGALAILVPEFSDLFEGIDRVNSIAFDFHKWGQVTYSCGCLLVHDKHLHRQAFTLRESYLAPYPRGIASAEHWYSDYGPELSRSFMALKVWFLLQDHGAQALGDAIRNSCELAQVLADKVEAHEGLVLLSETRMNIVCFGVKPRPGEDPGDFNAAIVADLQEAGIAAPSTVKIDGMISIRCCLINHRTTIDDIDILLAGVTEMTERRRTQVQ
jgi:aromatic-L-amino-acid decarboxylase